MSPAAPPRAHRTFALPAADLKLLALIALPPFAAGCDEEFFRFLLGVFALAIFLGMAALVGYIYLLVVNITAVLDKKPRRNLAITGLVVGGLVILQYLPMLFSRLGSRGLGSPLVSLALGGTLLYFSYRHFELAQAEAKRRATTPPPPAPAPPPTPGPGPGS